LFTKMWRQTWRWHIGSQSAFS